MPSVEVVAGTTVVTVDVAQMKEYPVWVVDE
jgi:hypothetical protein